MGRMLFHSFPDYMDQVCDEFLISFKNDMSKGYLADDYIEHL
jgi:hypothetical protein